MSRYIDADAIEYHEIFEGDEFIRVAYGDDIDELLTVDVPQWIPCSERLPEEIGAYMTTVDYDEFGVATGQRYFYNKEIGWDDDAVVAWMPLPEPWEGEKMDRYDPYMDSSTVDVSNINQFHVRTVQLVELTDECIEKIAGAVAKRLLDNKDTGVSLYERIYTNRL